jgi:transcriptional regulator with XRE-family HTH domain
MEGNQNKTLCNRLWYFRKRDRLGQKQLAYLMGHVSAAHVSHYERGTTCPGFRNLIKLEIIFSTSARALFPEITSQIEKEIRRRQRRLARFSPPL